MKPKQGELLPVSGTLHVDVYRVMAMAVESGVAYGVNRAFKHTDSPSREAIVEAVENAVLTELCEWFSFGE
jgi:hypothetical protein